MFYDMGHKFDNKFPRAAKTLSNIFVMHTFHMSTDPLAAYTLNRMTLVPSPKLNSMINRNEHSAVIQNLAKTLNKTAPFDGRQDLAMMFGIDNRIKVNAREIVRPNIKWEALAESIMKDKKMGEDEQLAELFFITKLIWWRILESKNFIEESQTGGVIEAVKTQRAEDDRKMDLRLFALFDKIDEFVKNKFGDEIPRPSYPGRAARAPEPKQKSQMRTPSLD